MAILLACFAPSAEAESPRYAGAQVVDLDAMIDAHAAAAPGEVIVPGQQYSTSQFSAAQFPTSQFPPAQPQWANRFAPPPQDNLCQLDQRYGGQLDLLPNTNRPWTFQMVPDGLIYHSYLAGEKEPRMGTQYVYETQRKSWLWDSTLGARIGILRYGTEGPAMVQGFQLDVEGAAMLRQDPEQSFDLDSVDFRAGIPLTFGIGRYQTKFAYYHLSSHIGDEFLLKNPMFDRINYTRNELVWGHSYFLTDELRMYFEIGWAFNADAGAKPWELQFGAEYAPAAPTGSQGAPFAAINGHLRQDLNYSGNLTAEAGWAWRGHVGGPLMRIGLFYYNGASPQYETYTQFEQQIGVGLWYDF